MSSASGSSAPRKQKRIHRACDSCRRRKHRCDGQEGQRCGNCTAAGRACTFSEKTQRASRKEVNRLKEELQSLKGDKKKSRSAAQPAEAEDRAFLQDSCFLGASSPFHLLCTLQKESTREVRSQTLVTSAAHPLLTGEKLPGEQRQRLEEVVAQVWPDAATETALLDAFFAQPHWIYPMFSEGAFKIQLSDEGSKGDFDFVRLAFALFAVASRYTEVIAESEAQLIGARFYDAWQRLETGGAIVSLSQIQSSLLATIYLMGTQLAASLAWLQLGKTVRMLQSVGAHRRGLADPWTRAWWIAYTLDREQACIFGRPLAIRDEDCDVGLPEDEEERWDRQTPLRGFISTLRLDAIIGSILLSGAPSGRASHDEHLVLDRLEQWRATNPLPYDLQQAKTPLFIQSSMLFLKYHYCRMLLARKAFLRGEAFQPTLEASQGIAKIIDGLLQRQVMTAGGHMAHARCAETALTLVLMHHRAQCTDSESILKCADGLSQLSERWILAKHLHHLLAALFSQHNITSTEDAEMAASDLSAYLDELIELSFPAASNELGYYPALQGSSDRYFHGDPSGL